MEKQLNNLDHEGFTLAKSPLGMIKRCSCGWYHIHIQHVTLQVSKEGFEVLTNLIRQAKAWEIQEFSFLS